jgi:hypothetical protein
LSAAGAVQRHQPGVVAMQSVHIRDPLCAATWYWLFACRERRYDTAMDAKKRRGFE